MSSTTTPSDNQLFITDDLEGRLDPDSLVDGPTVVHDEGPEPEDFYESNGGLVFPVPAAPLPDPIKVTMFVAFATSPAEMLALDGNLQALSFGKDGWLCTISTSDTPIIPIALRAAKDTLSKVRIVLPGGDIELCVNLDCTASFSYGAASFTATADEAHYV
jgi:hypothetical protein